MKKAEKAALAAEAALEGTLLFSLSLSRPSSPSPHDGYFKVAEEEGTLVPVPSL